MERFGGQVMEFALRYAADGFAVFPCRPKGKEPMGSLVPNGCLDATTDAETIKEWWTKCPNANIGIATGQKNGLAVVDLDGQEGIASGNRLGLSSLVCALTGNGKQLFYSDTEGKLKNSVKKLSSGIDTRGMGGYVVAPPSLHPNGKRYIWQGQSLCRMALGPLPSLLRQETTNAPISTIRKPDSWMSAALEELKKGHVHNTLISVLGKFRIHNFTEEDTYKLLQPYALENGRPFEGLRDKITEIWKRYQPGLAIQGPSRSETIDAFLEDIKEPEWICKPFIAKKSIGFVVGLPATLKTWLCIDLAVECARENGLWLGLFPVTNCKILFVDQERWKGETQRRFASVIAAKALTRSQLKNSLYLKSGTSIRLNIDSSYQAFRTELLEMRPELIIVDSFATFHTLPENDRTEIQKVLERIKELRNEIGCTFLFINHESKMAYPNGEPTGIPTLGTMVGSIGIAAAAEFCLTVRKVDENTSLVHHTKSTLSSTAKSFYASVVDVPEGIVVRGLND
jgi:bifunctional DNA primase/polymerase-like protein/AAA domain-containing protein